MNVEKDREQLDILLDKLYNSYSIDEHSVQKANKHAAMNCAGAAMKTAVDLLTQTKGKNIDSLNF